MAYREENGQVVLTMSREEYSQLLVVLNRKRAEKLRDFLLIVANDGANRVFLERNARELIADLDSLLSYGKS